jgi:hypothetical protein
VLDALDVRQHEPQRPARNMRDADVLAAEHPAREEAVHLPDLRGLQQRTELAEQRLG